MAKMRLAGKVALITGAGGGQGRAAAILFTKEGAKVAGCDLKVEQAKETLRLVKKAGGEMVSMQPVDLGDSKQVKKWVEFAVDAYGGIDILYNIAGKAQFAPFEQMTEEQWHLSIRNELDLMFYASQHAWPYLKASGKGVIINTASMSGMIGHPPEILGNFSHAATKGGIIAMTKQLALEGAPLGIRVNSISPGVIATPATQNFVDNPEWTKAWMQFIPMKRFGRPEEIANLALFLASEESSYITGANIVADGGFTAQ